MSLDFLTRSQTAGTSGLTNVQLKDLYSNCIKLSTENVSKAITLKFGHHIVKQLNPNM